MITNAAFPDKALVEYAGRVDGSRVFRLARDFRQVSSVGTITAPRGFLTDGASVPRPFWPLFDPFGRYFPAAIIHDWLYSLLSAEEYVMSRKLADVVFKEGMYNLGIGWWTRGVVYRAVRLGGRRSWRVR